MAKLSRRELGRLAGGLAAARAVTLRAQGASRPAYNGPLTGVTTDLRDRRFDPVAYTRGLYEAAPRRLRFRAGNRGDAEAWQKTLRVKLTELVGGFPTARTPLCATTWRHARLQDTCVRRSSSTASPASACSHLSSCRKERADRRLSCFACPVTAEA